MMTLPLNQRARLLLPVLLMAAAHCAFASIRGPYTMDSSTTVLLHLDEAAGVSIATNLASGSVTNFIAAANPTSATPRNPLAGLLGAAGATGFGNCANLTYSNSIGLFMDVNTNGVADLDTGGSSAGDMIYMSRLCGPSGEFTLEALVNLPSITGYNREILAMDDSPSPRSFFFRITSTGTLEFRNNIGATSGDTDLTVPIPTTGAEAFVANQWFHVALTYDGAGTINVYWTKLDNTRTGATLLQTFYGVPQLKESGKAVLVVGNENRSASGEGLMGYVDEVRISNVARSAIDMVFDTVSPYVAPSINPQPTDQVLGYGETLLIQSHASGTPTLQYVWQKQSGASFVSLDGQTGDSLSLPVTFDTAGDYRYIVSNAYGSATSSVAHVTVGANFSGLFRTGLDDTYTRLADGSVDPHYLLWVSADPNVLGPSTIACPVTDNSYNANDAQSGWIDPYPTLSAHLGVYTYRTTFVLDAADPQGASLSASILSGGPTTILLNGKTTGVANLTPAAPGPFRNLFSFTLTNGFKAGLNTLDFVVDNHSGAMNAALANCLRVTSARGISAALPAGRPVFQTQPQNSIVREGGKASFSAIALGRPPLQYQWYGDGAPIPNATNYTLTYPNAYSGYQPSTFTLVVSNDSGAVTSQAATLTLVSTNQPVVTTNLIFLGYSGIPIYISMSTFLQNSSDPDGDQISISAFDATSTNQAAPVNITQSGATYVYTNLANFVGADAFNVTLSDGMGGEVVNTVQIQIAAAPSLKIGAGPNQTLRLAWPAAATVQGFKLRYADSVSSTPSSTASETVQTEGTESAVYITPNAGARFYRLVYP